jgi:hypothetical protein
MCIYKWHEKDYQTLRTITYFISTFQNNSFIYNITDNYIQYKNFNIDYQMYKKKSFYNQK